MASSIFAYWYLLMVVTVMNVLCCIFPWGKVLLIVHKKLLDNSFNLISRCQIVHKSRTKAFLLHLEAESSSCLCTDLHLTVSVSFYCIILSLIKSLITREHCTSNLFYLCNCIPSAYMRISYQWECAFF